MAHRHRVKTSEERCYAYPVAQPGCPAAHGNIMEVAYCSCGAVRKTNINGRHIERGRWAMPVARVEVDPMLQPSTKHEFREGHSGDLACKHRDVSCCKLCADAHEEIVEVYGHYFWVDDKEERDELLAEMAAAAAEDAAKERQSA
jgi:hypothetical protein